MDILWQPLVNTLKETHILLMDVEHPTPEVVSPTWFTNFRKKKTWVVGQVLSINCCSNSGRCWVWIFLNHHGSVPIKEKVHIAPPIIPVPGRSLHNGLTLILILLTCVLAFPKKHGMNCLLPRKKIQSYFSGKETPPPRVMCDFCF